MCCPPPRLVFRVLTCVVDSRVLGATADAAPGEASRFVDAKGRLRIRFITGSSTVMNHPELDAWAQPCCLE